MIKPLAMFLLSALLSAAIQLSGSGCSPSEENTCNCPPPAKWPPTKAERPITMSRSAELPFELSQATIQVQSEQVVIRYAAGGEHREVTYSILPNE